MKPMARIGGSNSESRSAITRRDLAAVLATPALLAQTPISSGALPQNAEEELTATREQNRQNLSQLARFPLPMATEPAAHFKA